MPKQRPRILIYDVGDTLLETKGYEPAAGIRHLLALAAHSSGDDADGRSAGSTASLPTVEAVLERTLELNRHLGVRCEATTLEYSQQTFHRLLYDRFGVTFALTPQDLELEYWKHALAFEPEPGVEAALRAARDLGYRQAIISNTSFSGDTITYELHRYGLAEFFEFVVATADYGVRKPDPRIFQAALGLAGVDAGDAWYVGNTLEYDVRGAAAAGIRPVWYNRVNSPGHPPGGTLVVSGWEEFTDLLKQGVAAQS
ncbi:MAG: HAD family hydrolase [bacterium]